MAKKNDKKAKAAVKSTKKASKPAAKKVTKPAKKAAKPVAKKVTKPAKASKPVKPTPKAKQKPQAKKVVAAKPNKNKPVVVKKTVKKEVKKIVSKKSKEEETKLKKKAVVTPVVKAAKKEKPISKKAGKKKGKKSDDVDLDGEELDVDAGLLEIDPEAITDDEEEIEEVIVEEKEKEKKGKGRRRSRGGRIGMKKHYDSEEFVRKQVIKIDLTKALIKKPKKEEPKPFINNKDTRTRYNDKELNEFKEIIVFKLNEAKTDYDLLKQTLTNTDNHGTDDTSPTFKLLEDGSDILSKEEVAQLASRQEKYIVSLQNALVRIQNKTYGICRVTGRLIPKERLRSVPHATLSMDAKINQYDS